VRGRTCAGLIAAICASAPLGGCDKGAHPVVEAGAQGDAGLVSAPSATAPGAPRAGMVWIPAGVFRAGTPTDRVPRIAEEELPGVDVALGGFYIDVLPYPDEPGAIPTENVARDEAAHLCEAKSKRLCTELEWEHACKGPANTTYEYGDSYRAAACDTGVPAEQAAKRPSGERQACRSAFGVLEMHGGPWEWTDATWGRGSARELGVLRGGNEVYGELVGRCANGLARNPTSKSPSMGFRCCAGPRNEAKVDLPPRTGLPLERSMRTAEFAASLLPLATAAWGGDAGADMGGDAGDGGVGFAFVHAWTWRPVPNEELFVGTGCARGGARPRCGLIVARGGTASDGGPGAATELLHVENGFEPAEIAEVGDPRHLRFKGIDAKSAYLRDFTYAYGRIELGDFKR
jgi:sulfatase modifying factor 1